jgi:tetratricopeptide (TPR) repeat protein
MPARRLAAAVAVGVVLAGSALAQSRTENWNECASRTGDRDLAIGACTAIIRSGQETTDNLARAFTNRAAAYLDKGQGGQAIDDLSQAIQLEPSYVPALKLRGDLYGRSQRYDLALADWNRVVQLRPNDGDAYGGRALAYLSSGDYGRAIQDCGQALALNPNDAWAYYVRGLAKQQAGDASGGDADIARARQIDPNIGR